MPFTGAAALPSQYKVLLLLRVPPQRPLTRAATNLSAKRNKLTEGGDVDLWDFSGGGPCRSAPEAGLAILEIARWALFLSERGQRSWSCSRTDRMIVIAIHLGAEGHLRPDRFEPVQPARRGPTLLSRSSPRLVICCLFIFFFFLVVPVLLFLTACLYGGKHRPRRQEKKKKEKEKQDYCGVEWRKLASFERCPRNFTNYAERVWRPAASSLRRCSSTVPVCVCDGTRFCCCC